MEIPMLFLHMLAAILRPDFAGPQSTVNYSSVEVLFVEAEEPNDSNNRVKNCIVTFGECLVKQWFGVTPKPVYIIARHMYIRGSLAIY